MSKPTTPASALDAKLRAQTKATEIELMKLQCWGKTPEFVRIGELLEQHARAAAALALETAADVCDDQVWNLNHAALTIRALAKELHRGLP